MNQRELDDFGTRYAAAWSSQNPERLAAFFCEHGSLAVNSGPAAVGRRAIAQTAREYMAAFPDMVVTMDSMSRDGSRVVFRWTWVGTNTGPGGTGRAICLSGYESLALNADGLIEAAQGHFDEADYERQIRTGSSSRI